MHVVMVMSWSQAMRACMYVCMYTCGFAICADFFSICVAEGTGNNSDGETLGW